MRNTIFRALTTALTVPAVAVTGLAAPAGAAPPDRGTFEVADQHLEDDFCDSAGLTVLHDFHAVGRFQVNARGKDRLPYYMHHVRFEDVFTNASTDEHVRSVGNVMEKDLRVTDNSDGTLTLLVLATGNATLYDSAGNVIGRNPGQVRFEVLVDHAGTPADPSDDQFLEFLRVVKESTGRSDDFCAAALPALA